MVEGRDVTIYADGGRSIEVIHVGNDPRAPIERTVCQPGEQPESHGFKLRRGDFLIVRIED